MKQTPARSLRNLLLIFSAALAHASPACAGDKVPAEVLPFVSAGTVALDIARGDLDGDGREDIVLVLERQKAKESDPDIEDGQRPLLILIRQADGSLKEVKRNTKVVYCSSCGGMMGDPFQGVSVGRKTFTVSHYGGSAWRWSVSYTFNYSRRDRSWQLVKVMQESFHVGDPEKVERKVSTPPKHFGKIDIADFDPQKWENVGPR